MRIGFQIKLDANACIGVDASLGFRARRMSYFLEPIISGTKLEYFLPPCIHLSEASKYRRGMEEVYSIKSERTVNCFGFLVRKCGENSTEIRKNLYRSF